MLTFHEPMWITVSLLVINVVLTRHEVPYNSEKYKPWGLYFSKALFEGLIFGGTYVQREICISKLIGLACSGREIYHFCFVLPCIRGQIPSTSHPGAYNYYSEGRCNGEFSALRFLGGLYLEGLIFGILQYIKQGTVFRLISKHQEVGWKIMRHS